jgi:hypothetical protein
VLQSGVARTIALACPRKATHVSFAAMCRSVIEDLARLREVELKQTPFASVRLLIRCVPIETPLTRGFYDLFLVRVAIIAVTPEVIGSLEVCARRTCWLCWPPGSGG